MDQAFECYAQVLKVGDIFFLDTGRAESSENTTEPYFFDALERGLLTTLHVRDPAATYKQRIHCGIVLRFRIRLVGGTRW